MHTKAFRELRNILMKLYPDDASIHRILDDSGIDSSHIAFDSVLINNWHSVLEEAEKTGKIGALLDIVVNEYKDNKQLLTAHEAYKRSNDQSDYTSIDSDIASSEQKAQVFIWRNRWFIGAVVLLEFLLLILFLRYKSRFMFSLASLAATALLLYGALQLWYIVIHTHSFAKKINTIFALLFSVIWIIFVYQQIYAAIFPSQIEANKFGIAIATLYDGKIFFASQESQRVTDSLENQLKFTLQNEDISPNDIAIKRVGVVRTNEEAREEGKRVGAELILWGEISQQPTYTTIFLQLLETSLLTENPDFPRTLPLNPQISLRIPVKTTNPQDLAEILNPQNFGLANFSLGMFLYEYSQAPGQAAVKFEIAKRQFEQVKYNSEKIESSLGLTSAFDESAKLNLGLVYYYLAKSYQLQGAYSQSQVMLQEAAKYLPRDLAVWLGMMYNLRAMGNEEEFRNMAQCIIEMATQVNEPKIESDFCPSLVTTEQEGSFGESAVNMPTVNRFNQALAHEALNQYEQALSLYESILRSEQDPQFFIARLSAASVLIKLGRLHDAKIYYEQAKDLAIGNPDREAALHIGLATWYESQNRWDGALLEYDKASKLIPELPIPYLHRAIIYEKQNLDTLARQNYVDYIERVERQGYNIGSAYHSFAGYLHRKKFYQEAITNYRRSLPFETDKAIVYAHIGQVYVELNDQQKALQAFQTARQSPSHNRSSVYDLYGRALVAFTCVDEAIELFEQSIQESKDVLASTITKLNLAAQYQAIGDTKKAIEIYESTILFDIAQLPQDEQQSFTELQQKAQEQLAILKSITEPAPPVTYSRETCIDKSGQVSR